MSVAAVEGVDVREAGLALKKRCFLQRGLEIGERIGNLHRGLEGILARGRQVAFTLVASKDGFLAAAQPVMFLGG